MINTELIIKFMKDNKLNKTQFCKILKMDIRMLNRILNNDLSVNLKYFEKIVVYMKVKFSDLLIIKNNG